MAKLISKIFIKGTIEVLTGIHVGGTKNSLNIGEVDLSVIKTPHGVPYIPGSSLKGKLRSLLGKKMGYSDLEYKTDVLIANASNEKIKDNYRSVFEVFGVSSSKDKPNNMLYTRLLVRDAFLDQEKFKKEFTEKKANLDLPFTEVKFENTIQRSNGMAKPRQLERVPVGTFFDFELVYDEFLDGKTLAHLNLLKEAIILINEDYLGGHGSRGYGKIKMQVTSVEKMNLTDNVGKTETFNSDFFQNQTNETEPPKSAVA